jgi:hypothetical protein
MDATFNMRKLVLCCIVLLMLRVDLNAQNRQRLEVNNPVEGALTADFPVQSWGFYGFQDQMLSFRVQTTEGNLDPIITIRNADGVRIIGNDDYDYPNTRDALIEGITIPRSGEYELIVTSYGNTEGRFVLTMLPAYSTFAVDERFIAQGDWIAERLEADVVDGIATLQTEGIAHAGFFTNPSLELAERHYIEMVVDGITSRNMWAVGLTVHYQDPANYSAILINQRGEWRLMVVEDNNQRVIREWTPHPAIGAGDTQFRLGVLVDDYSSSVFYNGLFIGRTETNGVLKEGTSGVILLTDNAISSSITARVDALFITQPTEIESGMIFPTELIETIPRITAQELVRRGVIPANGVMAWEVPDSYLDSRAPGIGRLPLIESNRFQSFVLGTTVQLGMNRAEGVAACGLLFNHVNENEYAVAYLDTEGGYGISQRAGDRFEGGLFNVNSGWDITQPTNLVLVVLEDAIYLYINQVFAGQTQLEPVMGQVGNAIINFDPNTFSCQFRNTWVWNLDR